MFYVMRQNLDGSVNVLDTNDCTIETISLDLVKDLLNKGVDIIGAIMFCGQVEIILQPLVYFVKATDNRTYNTKINILHYGYKGEYVLDSMDYYGDGEITSEDEDVEEIMEHYMRLAPLNVMKKGHKISEYHKSMSEPRDRGTFPIYYQAERGRKLYEVIKIYSIEHFEREYNRKIFGGGNILKCIRFDNKVPSDYMYVSHSGSFEDDSISIVIYDKNTNESYELNLDDIVRLLYFENISIDGIEIQGEQMIFSSVDFSQARVASKEMLKQRLIIENTYKDSNRRDGTLIIHKGEKEIVLNPANMEDEEFNDLFSKLLFKDMNDYKKFKDDFVKASTSWYSKKKLLGTVTYEDEDRYATVVKNIDNKFSDKIPMQRGTFELNISSTYTGSFRKGKTLKTISDNESLFSTSGTVFRYITPKGNYPLYIIDNEATKFDLSINFLNWLSREVYALPDELIKAGIDIPFNINDIENFAYERTEDDSNRFFCIGDFDYEDNYTELPLDVVTIIFDNSRIFLGVNYIKTNYEWLKFDFGTGKPKNMLNIKRSQIKYEEIELTSDYNDKSFVDGLLCYKFECEKYQILVPVELSEIEV